MRKTMLIACCFLILVSEFVTRNHAQDEAIAKAVVAETPKEPATPILRPLTVTTGLTDDTVITGTLLDSNSIAIKTAFGEAAIPLSEVAGVRFPSTEDTSTTIVMLNGDSITGATDMKFVNVETTWGSAKINGQNVSTMLFVPGLTWQSVEGLGGKRWNLVESKPVVAGQVGVQPASGNRVVNPANSRVNSPQVIFGR